MNKKGGKELDEYRGISTGIYGFDRAIDMLRLGDNVVWQVEKIEHYEYVVSKYIKQVKNEGKKLIYIRFSNKNSVLHDIEGVKIYNLNPRLGFEDFTTNVHKIIENEGREVFYVFDSLTELQQYWYTDLMPTNFFKVICPFLNKHGAIAYFALIRDAHTYDTLSGIRETTQLLLDVYKIEDTFYIHPLKVQGRYSSTMFFPHKISEEDAIPITSSADTARLFSKFTWSRKRLGYWRKTIDKAKKALNSDNETKEEMKKLLITLLIGFNSKISDMCMKYFNLEDIVDIAYREIGTGNIGGKSIGMLLATKIITTVDEYKGYFTPLLESHDSFYIGTDVFYTYIVENGMWDIRLKQKTEEGYFKYASELRESLKLGKFSKTVKEQFIHMLEYYGQSPIVVRSSSLLEDSFGNAFAGKYESVFCVNQGTTEERLEAFEDAVKTVYASTMSEDAINYRKLRGLDKRDEQMAILVQRVSGDYYEDYFFPHIAGVGNSSNLYVWNKKMNMNAGMLRLVFGLGTRAVDRVNYDYIRIVALDDPLKVPFSSNEKEEDFSQRYVDLLDLKSKEISTLYINDIINKDIKTETKLFGGRNEDTQRQLKQIGISPKEAPFILNFKRLLKNTQFPKVMKKVLKVLSQEYKYPVDIEFTANFSQNGDFTFNIVQCRPLQTRGLGKTVELPKFVENRPCLFSSVGNFMGGNVRLKIDYVIFVSKEEYIKLTESEKYSVARQIGLINEALKGKHTMLMGPGRWGSRNPLLGVPVRFTELCNMSVMCEIAYQNNNFVPELSYGSHFFQDLVETGIFYVAIFDNKKNVIFNEDILNKNKNIANEIIEGNKINENVIKVYKTEGLQVYSDITEQIVTCGYEK
ncbi:MAG: PEP/pyruvate-binding domain-containing protein [Peptostreptococcaceae bacterium]